ncbi:MAG: hypothetical protein KTR16_13405 [Acidiferrobacterales bacterium]|nr:hypothetical protein [Acidiferrobacterales bacterium]
MPSLTDVLDHFPTQRFLINIKSNNIKEADLINDFLRQRREENLTRLWFYGAVKPVSRLFKLQPTLKGFSKKSVKDCILRYGLIGWTGYVPTSCDNTVTAIPIDYAPFLWGWPNLFVSRMRMAGTDVILVDQVEDHTAGIDDIKTIRDLRPNYSGYVWTDRIDLVSEALKK